MIRKIAKYINRFGLFNGVNLYLKIKFKKTKKVKIPKVKYPFLLRVGSSDIPTFDQVFLNEEYEMKLPFVPKTIIDAGANIGLASIYFISSYPEAQIVAIEPDDENYEVLCNNIKPYENINSIKAGLWYKTAELEISDKYKMGKWAMVVEEKKENLTGGINTITITEIMQKVGWETVDLLKIDIEGSERFLFKENYLSWLPKCKVIVIELHDWMVKGCTKIFFEALHETNINYSMSILGENIIIINEDLVGK
jgi:FkbM family methyltransferase